MPRRVQRVPVRRVVQQIPRGLVSDMLDVYDLEIRIVKDLFADIMNPSGELNIHYRKFAQQMCSLVTKYHINPEGSGHIKPKSFYIPFEDLFSAESEFQRQSKDLNDKATQKAVVTKMNATRKLIKDLLYSRIIDSDKPEKDGGLQKLIVDINVFLDERDAIRKGVSLKFAVHVDRKLGIYSRLGDKDIYYPKVRPTSQIFKTLLYLVEHQEPVEITTLASNTKQVSKSVKRSIGEFNLNFKRIFNVKADPIMTTGTGIYYANVKNFKFL